MNMIVLLSKYISNQHCDIYTQSLDVVRATSLTLHLLIAGLEECNFIGQITSSESRSVFRIMSPNKQRRSIRRLLLDLTQCLHPVNCLIWRAELKQQSLVLCNNFHLVLALVCDLFYVGGWVETFALSCVRTVICKPIVLKDFQLSISKKEDLNSLLYLFTLDLFPSANLFFSYDLTIITCSKGFKVWSLAKIESR